MRFSCNKTGRYTVVGIIALITVAAISTACSRTGRARNTSVSTVQTVVAAVETEPVNTGGDSADDATLWVNASDPSQSLVIGTNKKSGLGVYDLSGKEIQFVRDGQMNNVDHRDGFLLAGQPTSIVTASNRTDNSIAIYRINAATRRLETVSSAPLDTIEAYGLCMYKSGKTGKLYYFVTSKQGVVQQYELFESGKSVAAKKVREIKVGTQVEGCVADDELGQLYIGEEDVGIWKYQAEPDGGSARTKVDGVGRNGHLVADVEGLTIAYEADGKGYLIASSQGNDTFVIYRRESDNAYVKSFRIVAGDKIDAVTNTDGIHVTTANLGPLFPRGVFIAQDGADDKGTQNFKLVPWQSILGD